MKQDVRDSFGASANPESVTETMCAVSAFSVLEKCPINQGYVRHASIQTASTREMGNAAKTSLPGNAGD